MYTFKITFQAGITGSATMESTYLDGIEAWEHAHIIFRSNPMIHQIQIYNSAAHLINTINPHNNYPNGDD